MTTLRIKYHKQNAPVLIPLGSDAVVPGLGNFGASGLAELLLAILSDSCVKNRLDIDTVEVL